jgi:hypothetical protein
MRYLLIVLLVAFAAGCNEDAAVHCKPGESCEENTLSKRILGV